MKCGSKSNKYNQWKVAPNPTTIIRKVGQNPTTIISCKSDTTFYNYNQKSGQDPKTIINEKWLKILLLFRKLGQNPTTIISESLVDFEPLSWL